MKHDAMAIGVRTRIISSALAIMTIIVRVEFSKTRIARTVNGAPQVIVVKASQIVRRGDHPSVRVLGQQKSLVRCQSFATGRSHQRRTALFHYLGAIGLRSGRHGTDRIGL
jgi:hypothetical protein